MKRLLYLMLLATVGLTSCELETSDNGDLDGQWQMYQLDTLATNGITDMRDSTIFWAVQMNLLELKHPKGHLLKNIVCHFERKGDSLIVNHPRYNDRMESNPEVVDVAVLNKYGISNLREAFFVYRLNSNRMDLQSDCFRLHFRKY